MLYKSLRFPLLGSLLGLMVLLLTACTSPTMMSAAPNTPSSTTTKVQSTPTRTARVTTSTSCPAPGSGRAALLPPLTAKQNQSVVYLSQNNTKTTVRRYDTVTTHKKDLFTFPNPNNTGEASVSPDGHWITITSQLPGGSYAIQLVRIDGSYTQTLYCSQGTDTLKGALLSPDQHYLAFNEVNQNALTDTLNVLDTTTGKILIELSSQQPGYPNGLTQQRSANQAVAQATHQGPQAQVLSYSTKLMPLPGQIPQNTYVPIRWASNSSLYLVAIPIVASSGLLPHQLYQLLDINKHVDQQSNNLKSITVPLKQDGCLSYDITSDNTQLICSAGPVIPPDTTIPSVNVEPITGGTLQTVFQAPTNSQVIARASQGQTILFTVDNAANGSQFYRVQTDGTHLKLLTSTKLSNNEFPMWNSTAGFLPWTNVSFDGKQYALERTNNNGVSSLVIGSMNGGTTTTISTNIFTLIGWTAA